MDLMEITIEQATDENLLKLFHNTTDSMKVAIIKILVATQIKERKEGKDSGSDN